MVAITNKYCYALPSALSQLADLKDSIYCNLTMRLERHPAFPKELCPDSPRWFADGGEPPTEIDYIPLGSWLLAKLAGRVGSEEQLLKHISASCVLVTKREEGVMAFDLFDSSSCSRPLGVALVCFEEHWITLRGRAPMELHEAIIEDLTDVLARDAFANLAPCAFVVGGRLLGWDGEIFFGSRRKASRFHE